MLANPAIGRIRMIPYYSGGENVERLLFLRSSRALRFPPSGRGKSASPFPEFLKPSVLVGSTVLNWLELPRNLTPRIASIKCGDSFHPEATPNHQLRSLRS